jgi:hypothetical protein
MWLRQRIKILPNTNFGSLIERLYSDYLLRIAKYVIVAYLVVVLITALSVMRAANTVANTEASQVYGGGTSQLFDVEDDIATFGRRFDIFRAISYPGRLALRISFIVPPLDRQRASIELLMERVEIDQSAALSAIELVRLSTELNSKISDGEFSLSAEDSHDSLRESLAEIAASASSIQTLVGDGRAVGDRIADLSISGPVVSASDRMSRQENRLAEAAIFSELLVKTVIGDLDLVPAVNGVIEDSKVLRSGDLSISEFAERVLVVSVAASLVRSDAESLLAAVPTEFAGSEYASIVETLTGLNVAVDELVSGLYVVLDSTGIPFEALQGIEGSVLSSGEAVSIAITGLSDRKSDIQQAVDAIKQSLIALNQIDESGQFSLGNLGAVLDGELGTILTMSEFVQHFPEIAEGILGIDGRQRNYLVLGQSSDELRAAGGFTSSLWLLSFKSGALISSEYYEVVDFEDSSSLDHVPDAHPELQLHMDAGRMYIRDVGWNPHFEGVGVLAKDLFELQTSLKIDGVISLTQWAIVDIAAALGGLQTESGIIEPGETMSIIESGTDDYGTGFLSSLFDSLVNSISGDKFRSRIIRLMTTSNDLFESKDLMIYSEDPDLQSRLAQIGWSGELPNTPGDRLAIIDSNIGWNKVDRNVERKFVYELDLSEPANPKSTLDLEYTNDSSVGSTNCEFQRHIGSNRYDVLLDGCYWNFVRVYLPGGASLGDSANIPLPSGSIASSLFGVQLEQQSIQQEFDDNGVYVSLLFALEPQSTEIFSFDYTLPTQILKRQNGRLEYRLNLFAQAGSRGRDGVVKIRIPDGYYVTSLLPENGRVSDGILEFEIELTRDEVISLVLDELPKG